MIKIIALMKRKPGMSLEEFMQVYEEGHARFAAPYLVDTVRYERRFIKPIPNPVDGQHLDSDFDVVTEIWFSDQETFERVMGREIADPKVAQLFAADEAKLFDRPATRLFVIEQECLT